jgi:hypothetical protein
MIWAEAVKRTYKLTNEVLLCCLLPLSPVLSMLTSLVHVTHLRRQACLPV